MARTGSFTRAAQDCHVSQPSLSAQIAKLEDELGGALLERLRAGSRLTERGRLFHPRALEALRQLERAHDELDELGGLRRGEVTLGCLPTTGAFLLPRLLGAFRTAYPHLQVKLVEESSPGLGTALREGRIDLALLDEAGLGQGIAAEVLFREDLFVAVPADHPLAARTELALEELRDQPLVVMKSGHGFRQIVLDALTRAGVTARIVYESAGIDTVQALVEAGLGLTLVPAMMRREPGPVYLAILPPTPNRTLLVAQRETSVLTPAAEALRGVIFATWGPTSPDGPTAFGTNPAR